MIFLRFLAVEENNVLVGIVTVDDIIDVRFKRQAKTMKSLLPLVKISRSTHRHLWRHIAVFLGSFCSLFINRFPGSILNYFEDTLQQVVALAFFMPMIADDREYRDTVSCCCHSRALKRRINEKTIMRLIFRELRTSIYIGIVCSIIITVVAMVWQAIVILGFVVGSSLLATLDYWDNGRYGRADYFTQIKCGSGHCIWATDYNIE
ncbi:magnesium transporter [Bacillus sp. SL00103]